MRSLLGAAAGGRGDPTAEDLGDVTERLLALVDGLSVHRLLYPDRLARVDMERLMLSTLDHL